MTDSRTNEEIREFYIDPANWQGNARLPGEDFDTYQLRRAHENRAAKEYHKGTVFWNSAKRGTYRKNKPKNILTDLERAAVRQHGAAALPHAEPPGDDNGNEKTGPKRPQKSTKKSQGPEV